MKSPWIPAALLLGGLLPAQRGGVAPSLTPAATPPAAIPVVAPPVDHPAYAAQPLMPRNESAPDQTPAPPAAPGAGAPAAPEETPAERAAREFREKRVEGKALKRAVKNVRELRWHEKLEDAEALSAATGKPIFWVHALGDLDGFT